MFRFASAGGCALAVGLRLGSASAFELGPGALAETPAVLAPSSSVVAGQQVQLHRFGMTERRMRSPGMLAAGIVLTTLGAGTMAFGGLAWSAAERPGFVPLRGGLAVLGVAGLAFGGSLVLTGLPLTILGALPVTRPVAASGPALQLGPASAWLRVRF